MSAQDDIVLSPDPRLKQMCAPVEEINDDIKKLARRMLKDMYAADGCGMAAPQVGELVRLIVIDVDYTKKKKNPYVLINPEIVVADGKEATYDEGCLSFPGITVPVSRPTHVVVRARNLDGKLMQYEASNNLLSVCLQHEIDHINGVTMLDHLTPTARAEKIREYEEALAAGARPGDTGGDD